MRLFIIFVSHHTGHCARVRAYLRALTARYQPTALLVVENSGQLQGWAGSGLTVVAGDNRRREFSGWDLGVQVLDRDTPLADEDHLLFVNDSVCRKGYLRWLTLCRARRVLARERASLRPARICGPVEPARFGTARAFGGVLNEYVASFFFAMRAGTYRRLGALAAELPWADWLGAQWPEPLFRLPREPAYNGFYNTWLGCNGADGVGTWPGSRACPFTAPNYGALRDKAACILLESHLSAQLAGGPQGGSAVQAEAWVRDLYHPPPWRRWLEAAFARRDRLQGWVARASGARQ